MILVTGATGFLGHHLIPCLRQAGLPVRALVRPGSHVGFLRQHDVEPFYVSDISDYPAARRATQGCEMVVHAAGHFRFWGGLPQFWQTNVEGTAAILEAAVAAGVRRFIHISTVVVAGKTGTGTVVDESHPSQPQDFYQRTKLEGERMVLAYHRWRGLPAIILRPGAYYGPWGHYAFNRLFFEEPLRGWRIKVNHGRHITFPVYTGDVAQAVLLALERGRPGEVYNISGPSLSHNEANNIISDLAGISRWRMNVPAGLVVNLARAWTALSRFTGREPFYPINMRSYVFQDWAVSSDKARRELGYEPAPFASGAQATLEWYWQTGHLSRRRRVG
jgi:dihydroflavonol-4-reductase